MNSIDLLKKAKVWLVIAKNLSLNLGQLRNQYKCRFFSDRETLIFLKEHPVGITRFGDGELGYLSGYSFPHQKQDPVLRKKLLEILKTYNDNSHFLIALPYDILFKRYQERNAEKTGWNASRFSLLPYIKNRSVYGSAFCFRIRNVIDQDKKEYIDILFSLLSNKDVIFVGGGEPHPGLISFERFIKTPPTDAFDEYFDLLKNIKNSVREVKNPCVVLSCGITATALSAELNNMGILSYDVGLCFSRTLANFIKSSG